MGNPEWEHEEAYGDRLYAAEWMTDGEALAFIAKAVSLYRAASVSDENRNGENAERSSAGGIPARSSERGDALSPSLSPKEQKGE
ncbi:hypothetical protein [Microvirga puerhi]|uniref:Uncharacterized protein n=1 Tax=Microvirga puerhi TaxID=2876078 RepID=A0ABS7VJN1_9HYPH|nr:hypothetical protein [Microvirga puerhi]MBZ6075300.1 hypothetical protein [Microvirga puerhi]